MCPVLGYTPGMNSSSCVFQGCIRPRHSKDGLCRSHRRQSVAGKALAPLQEGPLESRFWQYVDKNGPQMPHMDTPCWVWTGSVNAGGYGRIGFERDGVNVRGLAHRVSYEMATGTAPGTYNIRHRCDNRPCVRPDHLLPGTQAENIQDAVERKRMAAGNNHGLRKHPERAPMGERHAGALLTEEKVRLIRAMHANGEGSYGKLAQQFGVSSTTIARIVTRRKWSHVD